MSSESSLPEVIVRPTVRSKEEARTRRLPPYHVVLENDDHHSFEFVIEVLQKALHHPAERAFQLTHQAHTTGRAVVFTGPKETAEWKAERVRTFDEIRADGRKLGPLTCTIEPAPGG